MHAYLVAQWIRRLMNLLENQHTYLSGRPTGFRLFLISKEHGKAVSSSLCEAQQGVG